MFLGRCQTLDLSDGRSALSAHLGNHLQWHWLKPYSAASSYSALTIRSHSTHMTHGWPHVQVDGQIQFPVILCLTEIPAERWMLHGYMSFTVSRSMPEFYTTLPNGSSISGIFTFFFTVFFSVLPLFGLNQMFLMQELMSCKHSDI